MNGVEQSAHPKLPDMMNLVCLLTHVNLNPNLNPKPYMCHQVSLSWTARDSAGNTGSATQTIVVLPVPDTTPPTISVPGPRTILMGQLLILPQVGAGD